MTPVPYTTPDLVRSYLGVTSDQMPDEALAQPIARAVRDLDIAVGGWEPYADTGLKFSSDTMTYPLTDLEAQLLSDATCAQVEYRMTVGDDFMIRDQYKSQSGPGYGTSGTVKKCAGAAYAKLGQGGFLKLTGRVQAHRHFHLPVIGVGPSFDLHFGDRPRGLWRGVDVA